MDKPSRDGASIIGSQASYAPKDPEVPLSPVEREGIRVGRLMRNPVEYSKRRVKLLSMETVNRLRWEVTQELRVPDVAAVEDGADDERVISLGIYSKRRLPDLVAEDAGGRQLVVLGRQARGEILARAFLAKFFGGDDGPGQLDDATPQQVEALVHVVARVSALPLAEARLTRQYWLAKMAEEGRPWSENLSRLATDPSFRDGLGVLEKRINVLAYITARPGQNIVVRHRFSEARPKPDYLTDFKVGDTPELRWVRPQQLAATLTWLWVVATKAARVLLRLLGLLPFPIWLSNLNAEHVESFHLVITAPEGLTIEDAYWQRSKKRQEPSPAHGQGDAVDDLPAPRSEDGDPTLATAAREFRRGSTTTLSAHSDDIVVEGNEVSWYGLQLAPSPLLLPGVAVVSLVAFTLALIALLGEGVCTMPGKDGACAAPDGLALGVMLGLPGLAAGALSLARSRVTDRIARGPRILTLTTAVVPYAIAVLLGFGVVNLSDVVLPARAGTSFAAFVAALLLWIRVCPRRPWRKPLGSKGGEDSLRKRWYRLRDFTALCGLAFALATAVSVQQLITRLS